METTGLDVNVTDLNEDFVVKLQELIAAAKADGFILTVASGFRDTALQETIFLQRYEEDSSGSIDWDGRKWSLKSEIDPATGRPYQPAAPPGESLHNHGYAVDFSGAVGPDDQPTELGLWLMANAATYGLRTYAQGGEPGHIAPKEITSVSQIPEAPDVPAGAFQWNDVLLYQTPPPVDGSLAATTTSSGTGSYADDPATQVGPDGYGFAGFSLNSAADEGQPDGSADEAAVEAAVEADAEAAVDPATQGGPDGPGTTSFIDQMDLLTGAYGNAATGENAYGYPTGFTLYDVAGTRYLVYEVSDKANPNSATAAIYYAVADPEHYLGEAQPMTRLAWNQAMGDYVDGGAASVLLDDDHIGRSWDQIMSNIMAINMNMAGTDATSDVGIMQGLAKLIANPGMGESEQKALWIGTDWYDSHTQKQIDWNNYGTAEKNLRIEEEATNLLTVTEYYTGIPADTTFMYGTDGQFSVALLQQRNPDLYQNAFDLASGAATQVGLVGSWIKPLAVDIVQSPHNRRLEEEVRLQGMRDMGIAAARSSVIDLYEQYGLEASGYTIDTVVSKLYMNQMSLDEIETTVKNHSLAKYPNKPLNMDWATYAEPYKDSFSSLLEVPRPGFREPTLARYLQAPTEGDGVQNVYEFEKQLRRDPRWEKTKNARDSYHSAFGQIGRLMGFG